MLFASIWSATFIFVVTYYFCIVNKRDSQNIVCRFFCRFSARSIVVLVQVVSIVLGCLGCQMVSAKFVLFSVDISREEWNILLFTIVYGLSWFLILLGGRIIAKRIQGICC